ncbi:hypothetical protein ACP_1886 [Acidobacterium capsulatum ATCC 51196]|uniref:Uncharacterized protein n=1 Tax=Acidobacterium capsulatum (strain ATCC 51196 / DSM 11244 / BCRC 80197 / JCM 7670 / NBRC 15755 / NCIMB 13165 / 161) TaxID=240015 RepID=C1F879_ACIC5|nr:hypothetical protein ACP_1886 [Acidobacterium capsulatum ATCC 51196]
MKAGSSAEIAALGLMVSGQRPDRGNAGDSPLRTGAARDSGGTIEAAQALAGMTASGKVLVPTGARIVPAEMVAPLATIVASAHLIAERESLLDSAIAPIGPLEDSVRRSASRRRKAVPSPTTAAAARAANRDARTSGGAKKAAGGTEIARVPASAIAKKATAVPLARSPSGSPLRSASLSETARAKAGKTRARPAETATGRPASRLVDLGASLGIVSLSRPVKAEASASKGPMATAPRAASPLGIASRSRRARGTVSVSNGHMAIAQRDASPLVIANRDSRSAKAARALARVLKKDRASLLESLSAKAPANRAALARDPIRALAKGRERASARGRIAVPATALASRSAGLKNNFHIRMTAAR